jgi:signal transduction histidine kinase
VQRIEKLGLFTINFTLEGEDMRLPTDKQIILFRVCQELLHNIVKHAQPTTVSVTIIITLNTLQITIVDDGIGFNVEAASTKNSGSGLINLYKRAKVIGGTLYLKSNPTSGTHCNIQIPLLPLNS